MPISGLPTDTGNNTVTVTPTGVHSANGLEGTDTLVVDYSSLSTNIYYRYIANGYYGFVDDFYTGIHFINFERYQITGGSGDDQLNGGDDTDILMGGAGADVITGGLGADTIDGGSGHDRWNANYGSLNTNVLLTLSATQTAQIAATGASVSGIEAVSLTLGAGADLVDTLQVTGNDDDVFGGAGNDEFRSGGGIDWFNGSDGTDRIVINYSDATTAVTHRYVANGWYAVEDKAGTQRAHYINVETFDITGGSGSDTLEGAAGNDRLVGGQGNDRLVGRAGVDIVSGGAGTDTWSVDYSGLLNANVNLVNQTTNTGAVISGIEAIQYRRRRKRRGDRQCGCLQRQLLRRRRQGHLHLGRGVDSVNGDVGTDKLVMDWSGIADPLHGISNSYVANGWYRFSSASGDRLDYIKSIPSISRAVRGRTILLAAAFTTVCAAATAMTRSTAERATR